MKNEIELYINEQREPRRNIKTVFPGIGIPYYKDQTVIFLSTVFSLLWKSIGW